MKKLGLTFNPYTKQSRLTMDGKDAPTTKERLCGTDGTDLALWASGFFRRAVDEFNDDIEVTFHGIERDYEFLEDSLKSSGESGCTLKIGTLAKPEDRLRQLKELFERMQRETPFEALKSDEQKELFERAIDSEFEMAVVATMTAGKSTLINAMLGYEILPARLEATTARTASIHDVAGQNGFRATAYHVVKHDDSESIVSETIEPLTLEAMNRLNDSPDVESVDIYGAIPGIDSGEISLVLTDTPGPNNSQTAEHQQRTTDLLRADWKPMILYILNAGALRVTDDSALLDTVRELINSGDRQSQDRFLFVLNKADLFDPDKESTAKAIDSTMKYLEAHGIRNPRIMPTSARLAKMIRQKRNGDALTRKELRDLDDLADAFVEDARMHFTDHARFISPATGKALKERIARAQDNPEELALLYSGVPSIEMAISEYLVKYAIPDKIAQGVSTFLKRIENLRIEADALADIEADKGKIQELQAALERLMGILKNGEMAVKVKKQIAELSVDAAVNALFASIRERMAKAYMHATRDISGTESLARAQSTLKRLAGDINVLQADFVSQTESKIGQVLREVADNCMRQYNQYIKDIMGAADFPMPAEIILPHDSFEETDTSIIGNYVISRREHVRDDKIENREASTVFTGLSSVRAGLARLFGRKTFLGKPAYVYVPVYETRQYFNFDEYLSNVLQPKLEAFASATRQTARKNAKSAAEKYKKLFLVLLEEMDAAIEKKADELKATLVDKKAMEKKLEQNRKNLEWLKKFVAELESILDLQEEAE